MSNLEVMTRSLAPMSRVLPSPAPSTAPAGPAVRPGPAFAVLVLAMLPAVLDQTVLAAALPVVAGQLGAIGDVSLLVTAYVLASTATTPIWGKLGDRHGRRGLLG